MREPYCQTCGFQLRRCLICNGWRCECRREQTYQHYDKRHVPYPRRYPDLPQQQEMVFQGPDRPMKDPRWMCAQGHDVRGGEHRRECVQKVLEVSA